MWCGAHRLELAPKDALGGTFFAQVDEMLLQFKSTTCMKSPAKSVMNLKKL